jgi:serine/threonine protein kinase
MKIPREFSHLVRIGHGSFSSVFRAYQRKLERHVVLKVIPIKRAKDAAQIEREAHVLASLRLQCVPHIYDVVRIGKNVIIVMEWVRGVPLSVLLETPPPDGIAFTIALNIVSSLTALHATSVVHRDLKPANILVNPRGDVVFVDFGFSIFQNPGMPFAGLVQGTPAYMAPELWSCLNPIDYKKADLFALGVIVKNLLGRNLPESAAALTATDPASRPEDCGAFEQDFRAAFRPTVDIDAMRKNLRPVVEDFVARLLLTGARELHGKGRDEEAYELLTESLDAWPDNPESLDFLQNNFSTPIRPRGKRKRALGIAVVVAAAAACLIAYAMGTRSTASPRLIGNYTALWGADDPKESFIAASHPSFPPLSLRHSAAGVDLTGTVVIIVPDRTGSLLIDKSPVPNRRGQRTFVTLPSGSHRIEWMDSTKERTWGETIELLPFESKTLSFVRFIDG